MRTPIVRSWRAGVVACVLSCGVSPAKADTEIVTVEKSPVVVEKTVVETPVAVESKTVLVEDSGLRYLVPAQEEVILEDADEGDRVMIDMTLPAERRVVGVRRFTVSRSPEVVRIRRPRPVIVEDVRSFAPTYRSFRAMVDEALVEHDMRHAPPVTVVDRVVHDDDDDDDD